MLTKTSKSEMDSMTTSTTPRRNTRRLRVITRGPVRNVAIVAMTQILLQARKKHSHIQSHNLSEEKCTTTDQAKGAEHNLIHFRSRKFLPSSPHKSVKKGSTFSKVSKEQKLGPIQNLGQQQG